MTEIVLALNEVEAGYGGGMVLQGFNLEVKKGSITCIVGPNGAGKSTLFKMILGLEEPDDGSITLDKTARIGYIAQEWASSVKSQIGSGVKVQCKLIWNRDPEHPMISVVIKSID